MLSEHVNSLKVDLGNRSYPILIGEGLLQQPDLLRQHIPARDVLIVEVIVPDGESHKTLATVARILDVLVANRFGRDGMVAALGGGVVGDMAGFAASCYQRGIGYVQVPTTLLAQVDSSVGGKTGVNHPGGKNLIGAFHQPRAVLADTATLASLPPRELRAGLAEVIKYGLIRDAGFFDWLEAHLVAELGDAAEAFCAAVAVPGPVCLRANRVLCTREELALNPSSERLAAMSLNIDYWLSALQRVPKRLRETS